MRIIVRLAGAAAVAGGLLLGACDDRPPADSAATSGRVVVYSARAEHLIKPLFDRYAAETGVEVVYTTDKEQPLIQRLLAEGENTRADLLLTVDAGNLWYAAEQGVLQPVASEALERRVPDHLQDPGDRWFALSVRARTVVYSTERVDPARLGGYADLADEQWRGRLCLRTSKKVYNQSLVAMLMAQYGEQEAERIVRGWVDNLATDVFPNDTKLIEAILAGQCDLGIVNTYYFGRLQKERGADLPAALHWPPADTGGVHVNVSGAGVTRWAPSADAAVALLEWLASPAAQEMFAAVNLEYPADPTVALDPLVASWGDFSASELPVARAGELQAAAVRLMDRAGYR